jgi:1-deoxy-D-xylulose-5-phosphate synthase
MILNTDHMSNSLTFPILEKINNPKTLRTLAEKDLLILVDELRNFLIHTVSNTGGHLASNLGVVELSIALHYVFDTPTDRLVWDVGHQSYPHKILTGRRTEMYKIRQTSGISGFPRRDESEYDAFGVGHSSTSISAALGMSLAVKYLNKDNKTIAVIGDGAMSAGMAFEALNHAGSLKKPNLLVILNDNDMSISPNVGALSQYLGRILASSFYTQMREHSKKVLKSVPHIRKFARRTEEHIKGMVGSGTLFEELGFNYIGPIDGHDLPLLIKTLQNIKNLNGPKFLHIVTQKGKGFLPAEQNPCEYHGVGTFNKYTGKFHKKDKQNITYTQVFSDWLCDMAGENKNLFGITPAMREGSGLVEFSKKFPERYIDVGIAEQHSVTLAAGLACEGIKPVVAIYSTFLQRAYDQLIHDVALQNLPVLFAIDRAGIVGNDGATHAGFFDLSYLRCIPNMLIMAPADENECRKMLTTGFLHNSPSAVRYPRGSGIGVTIDKKLTSIPIGKAEVRHHGDKICILSFGSMLVPALEVGKEINATVVNMRFVKPLDEKLIISLSKKHTIFVTIEENVIQGGAGSAVNEFLHANKINIKIINLGLPDKFIEHGCTKSLLAKCNLDKNGILRSIINESILD